MYISTYSMCVCACIYIYKPIAGLTYMTQVGTKQVGGIRKPNVSETDPQKWSKMSVAAACLAKNGWLSTTISTQTCKPKACKFDQVRPI